MEKGESREGVKATGTERCGQMLAEDDEASLAMQKDRRTERAKGMQEEAGG